ncbi:hypothetical protein F5Y09DRAFT_295308, partial [Xylaria sp. FL1042]
MLTIGFFLPLFLLHLGECIICSIVHHDFCAQNEDCYWLDICWESTQGEVWSAHVCLYSKFSLTFHKQPITWHQILLTLTNTDTKQS